MKYNINNNNNNNNNDDDDDDDNNNNNNKSNNNNVILLTYLNRCSFHPSAEKKVETKNIYISLLS